MTRVARHALGEAHELVAQLAAGFLGGPKDTDPFDTARLREASNLMARMCTRLGLAERYAITPMRGATPMVGLAFASSADFERVALLSRAAGNELGPARKSFTLDEETHAQLLEVAGEPDYDRAERRNKAKTEDQSAALSQRWT